MDSPMETAAIMAAPMLIGISSQPMRPMMMRMGKPLGTSATRAWAMLRNATIIISPIPAEAIPNVNH